MSKAQLTIFPSRDARRSARGLLVLVPSILSLIPIVGFNAVNSIIAASLAGVSLYTGARMLRARVEIVGDHLAVVGSWRTEVIPVAAISDVSVVEGKFRYWSWGRDWPPFRTHEKACLIVQVAPDRDLNPEVTRRRKDDPGVPRLRDELRRAIHDAQRKGTRSAG